MERFIHNKAVGMKGEYGIKVVIGTGTFVLQQQLGTEDYDPIDNTSKSATSLFNIDVADSNVRAVLGGDAVAYWEHIRA